jgi:hypothetical protein
MSLTSYQAAPPRAPIRRYNSGRHHRPQVLSRFIFQAASRLVIFHFHDILCIMPGKKHLRGATAKEQRQYEHIKNSAQRSGRYGKRAKEVAARTVMKHHHA